MLPYQDRHAINFNTVSSADQAKILAIELGDDPAIAYGKRLLEISRYFGGYGLDRAEELLAEAALLIENDADVNLQSEDDKATALHYAACYGVRPLIRLLVNSGRCDYLLKDGEHRYAAGLAMEWSGDFALARLLSKHQVRQAHERGVPAYEGPRAREVNIIPLSRRP